MYGEHFLSRQAIHNWVQKLSEGRTSIEDEHRAGRPVEIATPETFRRKPKEFYAAGFQGLVKRWDKCLNLYGDYVKNKCCLYVIISIRFFSITICNLLIESPLVHGNVCVARTSLASVGNIDWIKVSIYTSGEAV